MRHLRKVLVLFLSMALAIANEVTGTASSHTQLNFRPDNLTLIDLCH
jgi:hypothetical protein